MVQAGIQEQTKSGLPEEAWDSKMSAKTWRNRVLTILAVISSWQTLLWSDSYANDPAGKSALERLKNCISSGDIDCVNSALAHAADLTMRDESGSTVLHHATSSMSNVIQIVDLLLAHGVSINARDDMGWTALMIACMKGNAGLVDKLTEHGADINAAGTSAGLGERVSGVTPLMLAAAKGNAQVVSRLCSSGAHVNMYDSRGWTPLMFAARQGSLEAVKVLRRNGADPSARSEDGKTARDIAKAAGHREVVRLLRQIEVEGVKP